MGEFDDWNNRSAALTHDVSNTEKLYKAVAIVSHGNADGTCEIGRDEKETFFNKLEDAVEFINNRGGMKITVWDQAGGRILDKTLDSLSLRLYPIGYADETNVDSIEIMTSNSYDLIGFTIGPTIKR